MKETLQQLRGLQQLDGELKTLQTRLAEIPARVAQLTTSAETAQAEHDETCASIVEHKKQYKLAEVDLKAAEQKITDYSVQLYSAKTNEQYKAFLKEIETQKKLKSDVEDRMIQLMEESESLERKRQASEKESTRLKADVERKVGVMEQEKQELGAAIAERETRRATMVEALPAGVLKLYERIRKNKGGMAVVATSNERCGGCMNPVPAQRLLEIEREDRIYTCEACGRILVPEKK